MSAPEAGIPASEGELVVFGLFLGIRAGWPARKELLPRGAGIPASGVAASGAENSALGPDWLGVAHWKLHFYLRAKLECWVFGAVWPLIWWISSGVRPPGAVGTDIRTDST